MTRINRPEFKLTSRQRAFLTGLTDLYRNMQKPVHYSAIAQRLGLCSSTAYDMLKVLEQKGMVASQYDTPKKAAGPGRANILFVPTARTVAQFSLDSEQTDELGEWEKTRTDIMASLSQYKSSDRYKISRRLLRQSNKVPSPLASAARILAALLISLKNNRRSPEEKGWFNMLLKAPVTSPGMSSVAGLILGLSLADRKAGKLLTGYQEYIQRYITAIQNMSNDNLLLLQQFTLDAWARLQGGPA